MPRVTVFLITLMFVLPSDGLAQAVPSLGDRIRIEQRDGTILTGTLSTRSAETIQLSVGAAGPMVEVPGRRDRSLGDQPGTTTQIRQILRTDGSRDLYCGSDDRLH